MALKLATLALLACAAAPVFSQAAVQSTSWNSTFALSTEQIALGNLTNAERDAINQIVRFDQTLLANGGPHEDDFYNVPSGKIHKQSGKLLKLEEVTDPTGWTIPATTSMSRFLYTTTNYNGTHIPASAYILWPYTAKKVKGVKAKQVPSVLWTHGTSGFYSVAAPSAHRSLFYQDFVPYALALAGYAVIAPDYAGLGVGSSWDGTSIPHEYGLYTAGAGDALNAMRAALEAFPERLSKSYVSVGHSQGGAVGWGVPELLAQKKGSFKDLVKGHLGTILFAPPTDGLSLPPNTILVWVGKYLKHVFPDFKLSEWLTPLGVDRVKLFDQIEGGQSVTNVLFQPEEAIVQSDWRETWAAMVLQKIGNPGNKPYQGPMLIIQGDKDPAVNYNATLETFRDTCKMFRGDMEFLAAKGAGHFPSMYASRPIWMEWLEDRFEGRALRKHGCVESEINRLLPEADIQANPNNFPLWAGESQWQYELPQGH